MKSWVNPFKKRVYTVTMRRDDEKGSVWRAEIKARSPEDAKKKAKRKWFEYDHFEAQEFR
jgi:uncharacterized protein YxjI